MNTGIRVDNSACDNVCNGNFLESDLSVVSYNMHGYRQGKVLISNLIQTLSPDLVLLQEHWLTPDTLTKFNVEFSNYYAFGSSALGDMIESGPLVGRPFGGVMTLIRNDLLPVCECVNASERFVIVKVGDVLCVNVYLPCFGTVDRESIYEEVLEYICYWRSQYPACSCILGGDFNVDLDVLPSSSSRVIDIIKKFVSDNKLCRCDQLFVSPIRYTYLNEAQKHYSKLDYFMCDDVNVKCFEILDPDINFSDHLPILIRCVINTAAVEQSVKSSSATNSVIRLRWDHGNTVAYFSYSLQYLHPIFQELLQIEKAGFLCSDVHLIDEMYNQVVQILSNSASLFIPNYRQNFLKFWWNQELECLKQESIDSSLLWKSVGRPRSGPIYERRNRARRAYRSAIRKKENDSVHNYSNDLHEALLKKNGTAFWNCWNSKFENRARKSQQVDGITDPQLIAKRFAEHFAQSSSSQPNSSQPSADLENIYRAQRAHYVGSPHTEDFDFDTELIEEVISSLSRGKAAGADHLTAEHLHNCHPILCCVLAKLFNWMMRAGHVPPQFGISYTVPVPKSNVNFNKGLTVNDYRGISISPILSKVFEHCVLRRFSSFLTTSDNQFGFKKSLGCSQAIYSVRCIVDHYVSHGSTVNLCALDVSKAFDRMSHHGLFSKLISRFVPFTLLAVLEDWFSKCYTYVCWNSHYSAFFRLSRGVRQGGVLSPYLFALFIDDVIGSVARTNFGCKFRFINISIVLYADDILLLAPSIYSLQTLLTICENKLRSLDLEINVKKSMAIRIGPRFNAVCPPLLMSDGRQVQWVDCIRYLGVYIKSSRYFRCLFDRAKRSFYRSFNVVFGKIGRSASEEVILHLISSKCLPCLLYGLDVCPANRSEVNSLEFPFTRVLMKLFKTKSKDVVNQCQEFFGLLTVAELIRRRKLRFLSNYVASLNSICLLFRSVALAEQTSLFSS